METQTTTNQCRCCNVSNVSFPEIVVRSSFQPSHTGDKVRRANVWQRQVRDRLKNFHCLFFSCRYVIFNWQLRITSERISTQVIVIYGIAYEGKKRFLPPDLAGFIINETIEVGYAIRARVG